MGRAERALPSQREQGHSPPDRGSVHLTFEAMNLPADPGLSLIVYGAEPGSGSQDALKLLASWTANQESQRLPGR
jgi:hypothetical protein